MTLVGELQTVRDLTAVIQWIGGINVINVVAREGVHDMMVHLRRCSFPFAVDAYPDTTDGILAIIMPLPLVEVVVKMIINNRMFSTSPLTAQRD
jgi:hypothetical protein